MRLIPKTLEDKLKNNRQTKGNNNQINSSIIISREYTPLTTDDYLEQVKLGSILATDCDIAVQHSRLYANTGDVYIAALVGSYARVYRSPFYYNIEDHLFSEVDSVGPAKGLSIGFDGIHVNSEDKTVFVTDEKPWLFWIGLDGSLKTKKIGSEEVTIMAENNVTDVSCIRAPNDTDYKFDYGFCVFFCQAGKLYYRQLIKGVWDEVIQMTFGSFTGITNVTANLTWDYRVVLTLKHSGGNSIVYSEFLGFAKHFSESVYTKVVNNTLSTKVTKYSSHNKEMTTASARTDVKLFWGWPPVLKTAENVSTDIDWGRRIIITSDVPLKHTTTPTTCFSLLSNGKSSFTPTNVTISGNKIQLDFVNFNEYEDSKTAKIIYSPSNISEQNLQNEIGALVVYTEIEFVPRNLFVPKGNCLEAIVSRAFDDIDFIKIDHKLSKTDEYIDSVLQPDVRLTYIKPI